MVRGALLVYVHFKRPFVRIRLLLAQDASVLCVIGNFLLLNSLAVVLCSVTSSYGNLANNEWYIYTYTHLNMAAKGL